MSTVRNTVDGTRKSQYNTEELQRVIHAKPGEAYTFDGCVNTTATYGDRFRPLTRYT